MVKYKKEFAEKIMFIFFQNILYKTLFITNFIKNTYKLYNFIENNYLLICKIF